MFANKKQKLLKRNLQLPLQMLKQRNCENKKIQKINKSFCIHPFGIRWNVIASILIVNLKLES